MEIASYIWHVVLPYGTAYYLIGVLVAYASNFDSKTDISLRNRKENFYLTIPFWPLALGFFLFMGLSTLLKPCFKLIGWLFKRLVLDNIDSLDGFICRLFKKEINRDEFGILYEMPSRLGLQVQVRVEDSTGVYWIPVPRNMHTAKEAVAWTYDTNVNDFHPVRV